MEGIFGKGDILIDLLFWLEDGFGEGLDCIEELCSKTSTLSSWCKVHWATS
jgi:hypothetical protein